VTQLYLLHVQPAWLVLEGMCTPLNSNRIQFMTVVKQFFAKLVTY